jgi:predicted ATPase
MYLSNAVILNSGPIAKLHLTTAFNQDGTPKPTILVGANGSGKTGALSIIGDALIEIAAQHFSNVTPAQGVGRAFFRMLGSRNQRVSSSFELSALRFVDAAHEFYYRAKSGTVLSSSLIQHMAHFSSVSNWDEKGNEKVVVGPTSEIERIYNRGAYAFFPSTRFELPHWVNVPLLERDPDVSFTPTFSNQLSKPIVVQSAIQTLKPWLIDVMLDQSVDSLNIMLASDLNELKSQTADKLAFFQTFSSLNQVLQITLGISGARLVRTHRGFQDRRICIAAANEIIIPSLDHLSAGQAALFALFGTIVRYSDLGAVGRTINSVEGVVVIDEIEAHLHADLQHEALPKLIKLFPRIQFILSSHSPLFLLGMRKAFGDERISIIDLPSGLTIEPERFVEFEASFAYFQATRAFETVLQAKFVNAQQPLALLEGETDPKYLRTAAELLGMPEVANQITFDWIGQPAIQGAQGGGGKSHLNDALKFLKNNPQFLTRRVAVIFDSDASKAVENHENLHVRSLPANEDNSVRRRGIENLLPEAVFENRFFEEREIKSGDDKGSIRTLNKRALCDFLCDQVRNPDHFAKLRKPLEEIRDLLLGTKQQA